MIERVVRPGESRCSDVQIKRTLVIINDQKHKKSVQNTEMGLL